MVDQKQQRANAALEALKTMGLQVSTVFSVKECLGIPGNTVVTSLQDGVTQAKSQVKGLTSDHPEAAAVRSEKNGPISAGRIIAVMLENKTIAVLVIDKNVDQHQLNQCKAGLKLIPHHATAGIYAGEPVAA